MTLKFKLKQYVKMLLQDVVLPILYMICSRRPIQKGLVIFADAHHTSCPFSMEYMRNSVRALEGICVKEYYLDFQNCSGKALLKYLLCFMKDYAKAEYVFICDNFLPVSSCKKRAETYVVQLWHSGGLLKKAGYDSEDCIPAMYKGEVYKNYNLFTVSAPCCVDILASSMHQRRENVKPLGISRSDWYFDEAYNRKCRENFYEKYPEAGGKIIVMWAPTFRGNAANPYIVGEEDIEKICSDERFYLIKKLHPHMHREDGVIMPSEQLFEVTDLLITDYSSILFDYLAYKKPFVFFAPDYKEFADTRGLYVEYESFPTTVACTGEELERAINLELKERRQSELEACYAYHMASCDGHATQRILEEIGLLK